MARALRAKKLGASEISYSFLEIYHFYIGGLTYLLTGATYLREPQSSSDLPSRGAPPVSLYYLSTSLTLAAVTPSSLVFDRNDIGHIAKYTEDVLGRMVAHER